MPRVLRLLLPLGAALLAEALSGGCAKRPAGPALTRLLPALGSSSPVTLDHVTRHATLLRPGDSRTCAVAPGAGARLRFSIGLPKVPSRGHLEVRASVGGRTLVDRRVASGRLSSWMEFSTDLPPAASSLTLEVRLVTVGGRPLSLEGEEVWLALGNPRIVRPVTRPPRVVLWISQDTVRADRLGAYGYPHPTSPVLDRLAGESLLFENAMSTASWTLPALGSQVTSLLPSQHGAVWSDLARRPENGPSVFEVLSQAGFTVLGASGNVFFSAAHGLADGFDTLLVHSSARADALRWRLEERLADWDGGDLALFIHFMDPHLPYTPPVPYDRMFPRPVVAPRASADERKRAAWSTAYDGELAYTDAEIGKWLGNLDRRGLVEGATILYTADHGDELLEHGGFDHGHSLYEELVHVPLVVRLPRDRRPHRIAEPVSGLDIAPTLLAVLGLEAPKTFQGESLLPLAEGKPRRETFLFAETQHTRIQGGSLYAARQGSHKAILSLPKNPEPGGTKPRLFDLERDPGERQELSVAGAALRRAVEANPPAGGAAVRDGRQAIIDAEALEQLRALGYIR